MPDHPKVTTLTQKADPLAHTGCGNGLQWIRRLLLLFVVLVPTLAAGGVVLQCRTASLHAARAASRVSAGMSVAEAVRAAQAPHYGGRVCLSDGTEAQFDASLVFGRAWFRNETTPMNTHDDIAAFVSEMRFCKSLRVGFFNCLSQCKSYFDVRFDENTRVLSVTAPQQRF